MLTLKDVEYGYSAGAEPAVKGVSLHIAPGEAVGLVGHTGSGKSTLAQLMAGLLKADAGEIWLGDVNLAGSKRLKAREICRRVGIVFQYAEDQLFAETVRDEIAYAPRNLGWPDTKVNRAVLQIARELGLDDMLDASPMELSGGEMRRVALASVLVMQTPLLILDEPFVGLDAGARAELLALLGRWRRDTGAAIVCVSHDIEYLVKLCGRLLVMKSGRLVLDEEIRGAFDRVELLAQCGVYPPVGRQAVRALGINSGALTVDEAAGAILNDSGSVDMTAAAGTNAASKK